MASDWLFNNAEGKSFWKSLITFQPDSPSGQSWLNAHSWNRVTGGNLQQRWAVNDTDQKRSIYLVKSVEYQPERVVGFNNRFAWRRWRGNNIIVMPRVCGKNWYRTRYETASFSYYRTGWGRLNPSIQFHLEYKPGGDRNEKSVTVLCRNTNVSVVSIHVLKSCWKTPKSQCLIS